MCNWWNLVESGSSFPCDIVLYANAQLNEYFPSVNQESELNDSPVFIGIYTQFGQKISVVLEELGLSYTPHTVNVPQR